MTDKIKPRPYQIEALNKIYADLQVDQNVLLVAIMGAGKTFMSVKIIERLRRENPEMRFLVLAHKKELCSQFYSAFEKFTDIGFQDIGICCAGIGERIIDRQVTIASIQTFINVREDYGYANFFVIDECHRIDINGDTQYNQIIDYLRKQRPNSRLLGITATPARLGHGRIYGKMCRPGNVNLFEKTSHRVTYAELRDAGYLVPLRGVVANHENLETDLAGVSTNGDYVIDQLGEIMTREIHLKTAVDAINEYCPAAEKICVFCCTIDHAEKLKDMLGDSATTVHSQLSDFERNANMQAWMSGVKPIMTSVNILVEGFDLPELDCLVFARPTLSSTLFLQAVGRVLRTAPGKESGLLVDLTDNTARFGTDLDNVKITIPKAAEDAVKDIDGMFKICPNCELEVHKALRICLECGFEWPEAECVIAEALPDMKQVSFDSSGGGHDNNEKPDPQIKVFPVDDFSIEIHTSKKNGKKLGRVTYYYMKTEYSPANVSLWLCLPDNYSGFAVDKSMTRWIEIGASEFPKTVEQFMNAKFKKPTHISVDVAGRWPQLESVICEDGPGGGADAFDDNCSDIPF